MTLKELLDQQFKVKTDSIANPVTNSVGAAATRVLGNNPNRLAWVFINLSANTIYLEFSRDVGAARGILVSPNGGSAMMVWNEDFELTGYEVWGLAPAGASTCYVLEVVTVA